MSSVEQTPFTLLLVTPNPEDIPEEIETKYWETFQFPSVKSVFDNFYTNKRYLYETYTDKGRTKPFFGINVYYDYCYS